jgi:hypothetical protein
MEEIMFDSGSTFDRRGFLGSLVAGAATLGLASLPMAERLMAEPGDNDLGTSAEAAIKKLAGRKHKQVFDAPAPHESLPVIWSWAYMTSNNSTGVADKDVGALVILRHEAIPLAMESRLWEKYKFGEMFKINDKSTNAPSVRNVVYNIKPEDMPLPDMAMEKMQARGVVFGVCDLAMTVYSMFTAQAINAKPEDVKADWVSGLLPGIVRFPSGVWAVNRAQEAGLTYCFAG